MADGVRPPGDVSHLQRLIAEHAPQRGMPPARLQRWLNAMILTAALDRVRDEHGEPIFLLKGGLVLELRLQLCARATSDYDAAVRARIEEALDRLDQALAEPWGGFQLTRDAPQAIPNTEALRVRVRLSYRGRSWGSVQLELAPVEGRMGLERSRLCLQDLSPAKSSCVGVMRVRWGGRTARLASVVIAATACSLCCAPAVSAMTACEAVKPAVEHVRLIEVSAAGATLEAQINPQNSPTTYQFMIVQQLRNPEDLSERGEPAPEGLRVSGGPIPVDAGAVTVSGLLTGLQHGYVYWYEVAAENLAGETRSGGDNWFSYFYTGGFPSGLPAVPYKSPPPAPCELEMNQQVADRTVARAEMERRQQIQEAEESTLKRHAEETAAAHVPSDNAPLCIVPALTGDTLNAARRAIEKAHCRLGGVREAHRHRRTLIVIGQTPRHGRMLVNGSSISVTMGVARSRQHRAG